MGIQGLIPFMEKASRQVNVKQYAGYSVAVDGYCWLHKGAFSCAEKLARGEPTTAYVHYCMKFVNMLLAANVTPIMVFDGRHLPAKASTEKKRRESRETSRKRGAELLRAGRVDEARSFLRRCVDVTHEMALALMKECRRIGVDCIVAPYEADAQLAYLNLKDIVQVVITEDSDLVLFGCSRILFKMDLNGNGLLVEQERLFMAMRVRPEGFCFDKFRNMCILSGCDYLASLPGIGLSKACKFVTKTAETDIHKALTKLPSYLNMNHLKVTLEYRDDFVRAVETFRYQLVFDPLSRKLVPLTDPPDSYSRDPSAGEMLPVDVAYQLALGNLDPFTLRKVDNFDPDTYNDFSGKRKRPSMWSRDYKPRAAVLHKPDPTEVDRPTTRKKVVTVQLNLKVKQQEARVDPSVSDMDLTAMYGDGEGDGDCAAADRSPLKRTREEAEGQAAVCTPEQSVPVDEPPCKQARRSCEPSPPGSPILAGRLGRNPFAVHEAARTDKADSPRGADTSPGLLARLGTKFGALGRLSLKSTPSSNVVVCSRYFVSDAEKSPSSKSTKETPDCHKETVSTEVSESRQHRNSKDYLKDVSNLVEWEQSSMSKVPMKASPSKQQSRVVNIEGGNKCQVEADDEDFQSSAKLNTSLCSDTLCTSENSSPARSQNSFKWGALHKRFSYEASTSLQLSRSTSLAFKNPRKDDCSSPLESASQGEALSQGSDNISEASATSADSGFLSQSPRSQSEQTPDVLHPSKTETCRRPGLKKPAAKQLSLRNLFGYQNKKKLAST